MNAVCVDRSCLLVVGLLVIAGCGEADPPTSLGGLRTELTGVSVRGLTYRLRQATFTITGPQDLSVSSENYLDQNAITLDLESGAYAVTLNDGWFLERAEPDGSYTGVMATLLSDATQNVTVMEPATTLVTFTFRAGEDTVAICDDCLSIQIAVDDNTCPNGVTVSYAGSGLPAAIAGHYVEAFDCVRAEGGAATGPEFTHCFRKSDGSTWRLWNTGCGWEYGLIESSPDPRWTRHARTYNGQCASMPASQRTVGALTTSVFYDRFGGPISGVSSVCE